MKNDFFRHNLKKILKYKISRKSIQWKPSCMRTDTREQSRNFANAPKNVPTKI
jgi:hypothetical protein